MAVGPKRPIAHQFGLNELQFRPYPAAFVVTAFAAAALLVTLITGPRSLIRRGATLPSS